MGKYGKYEKKYKKSWEQLPEFTGWLEKNSDAGHANKDAYCKICNTALRAQKNDLEKHSQTKIHRDNASKFVKQKKLASCGVAVVSDENKSADLKLAVYVATHSAVRSIDHLSDLLIQLGKKSTLESLHMHRTKCTMLIKNVISPALLEQLIEDVGNEPYSLIIDESTDISVQKYMAVCIRYFSSRQRDIVTEFLGIIPIIETTAVALYDSLTGYLKEIELPLKNLIGIGTDGASNLCGKNHSLYTLLKERVPLPNLQIVRCICHSLHLCSSKASEVLPSSLEFLVQETRNWFAYSPLRSARYADLFNAINDNNKAQLKLVQLSVTRWLAWEGAVKRILYQWLELKTHFEMVTVAVGNEKCYTARTLCSMYKDPTNHLYLVFLKATLRDVNETNVLFQSTQQEITKLYDTLSALVLSVASRIITQPFMDKAMRGPSGPSFDVIEEALNNELAFRPHSCIDFGIEFKNTATAYNLKPEELNEVKGRCRQYLIVLLSQLLKRLPSNMTILKLSAKLSAGMILNTANKVNIEDLPITLLQDQNDVTEIERQLRKIPFIDWSAYFSNEIMQSSTAFWSNVRVHTDAGGSQPFDTVGKFALRVLSLPISNAVVERVFSIMNATKTKPRNKMNICLLEALLRIRTHFHTRKICCTSFVPSALMFKKFTSKMYDVKVPLTDDLPGTSTRSEPQESQDDLAETLTLFAQDEFD